MRFELSPNEVVGVIVKVSIANTGRNRVRNRAAPAVYGTAGLPSCPRKDSGHHYQRQCKKSFPAQSHHVRVVASNNAAVALRLKVWKYTTKSISYWACRWLISIARTTNPKCCSCTDLQWLRTQFHFAACPHASRRVIGRKRFVGCANQQQTYAQHENCPE